MTSKNHVNNMRIYLFPLDWPPYPFLDETRAGPCWLVPALIDGDKADKSSRLCGKRGEGLTTSLQGAQSSITCQTLL